MIDPSLPYSSQRAPVCAANIVATSQPLAAQAGLEALINGGNAIDAAIAAAITLTVVEPSGNGIGSDAFALLWDGTELVGINGSGRSPAAWTRDRFARYDQMPAFGWDTVTVPGAVSVWATLSKRYGKLRFTDLFKRAIEYAKHGFQVGPKTASMWQNHPSELSDFPDFVAHFHPAPAMGQRVTRSDMVATLQDIAESSGESFYRGALAERIERAAIKNDAALRASDLATHEPTWVTPISTDYRDVTAHEIPPNGQGVAALIALGVLGQFDAPPIDSAAAIHLQIEAMKIGINTAASHVADPDFMNVPTAALLEPAAFAHAAKQINQNATSTQPVSLPTSRDTVYLTAADQNGMMVSFIQSNYYGFGSGIVIPGTGIAMQNRGRGFSLEPGHPNEVGPSKRPFHTIIPGFLTGKDGPLASLGVMGGPMQPQGHVQMITRLIDYKQNPQAASDAPRWLVDNDFGVILELGFNPDVANELARRGHTVSYAEDSQPFGGAQIILRTNDGYIAGSDHRKEGLAVGF
jgi:gamma-glutamyltranspeptidase/glutathione hydrolase